MAKFDKLLEVSEKTVFADNTGKTHPYKSWAERANLEAKMCEEFSIWGDSIEVYQVLNLIDENKDLVRLYISKGEEMQNDVFELAKSNEQKFAGVVESDKSEA